MGDERTKSIIAYFDCMPLQVLGAYLRLEPKQVYKIYSDMIKKGEYQEYKRKAKASGLHKLDGRLRSMRFMLKI